MSLPQNSSPRKWLKVYHIGTEVNRGLDFRFRIEIYGRIEVDHISSMHVATAAVSTSSQSEKQWKLPVGGCNGSWWVSDLFDFMVR